MEVRILCLYNDMLRGCVWYRTRLDMCDLNE